MARTVHVPVPEYVSTPELESTEHEVVVLLTFEYEIEAPPRALAGVDGVNGDCTVVTAPVGDHVTDWAALLTVNVTSVLPAR